MITAPDAVHFCIRFQQAVPRMGAFLRKLALLLLMCAFLLVAGFARAQQVDIGFGYGITLSSKNSSSSLAYPPPSEKGGTYPSASLQYLLKNHHYGFNAEVAVRRNEGLYNGFQRFRPFFYDFNAVFAPRINSKTRADVMAGIGATTILFYNQYEPCSPIYTACTPFANSTHLMGHIGGDVRYYFWRRFFVRPEAHLYLIHNNFQFNSAYVARVGASIGFSFHPR